MICHLAFGTNGLIYGPSFSCCPAVYMFKPHARNTILQHLCDLAQGRSLPS